MVGKEEGFFFKKRSFSLFWFIWEKKRKIKIRFSLKKDFFSGGEKKTKGIIKKMEKKINLLPFFVKKTSIYCFLRKRFLFFGKKRVFLEKKNRNRWLKKIIFS